MPLNRWTRDEALDPALKRWAEENNSIIIETPSGKIYALVVEPDGENPHCRFVGNGKWEVLANLEILRDAIEKGGF